MILKAIVIIAVLIIAITFHELGHICAYGNFREVRRPMRFNKKKLEIISVDDPTLTKEQWQVIFIAGILAGLYPIMVYVFTWAGTLEGAVIIAVYIAGCRNDVLQLLRTLERVRS